MIQFNEIFNRAVSLFDDPDIRKKCVIDPAGYQKDMRAFLINGINYFYEPTEIANKLTQYSDQEGQIEVIDGENTDVYKLSTNPVEGAVFSYKIGNEFVRGSYNAETNSVTFPRIVTTEQTCTVVWYYAGAFTADFGSIFRPELNRNAIMNRIKTILAHCLLCAWGDGEKNRALEFRNLLSDADLATYSPANSAKAKTSWHEQVLREMDTLVVDLSWSIASTPRGGSQFGK